MVISFVGWFGTETIGDRAILAGILRVISLSIDADFNVRLGSLYIPLTMRTILEDMPFLKRITGGKLKKIDIFDSLSVKELNSNIKDCDCLLISGGPLGDMDVMYMVKYAFLRAKHYGIRTAVYGNGWGPFKRKGKYVDLAVDLINMADCSILRDGTSVQEYVKATGVKADDNVIGAIDPAFFAAQFYKKEKSDSVEYNNMVVANFRELFVTEKRQKGMFAIDDCVKILESIANNNPGRKILLVPMHTFVQGGDDRIIENKLAQAIESVKVDVQNDPMSLEETMNIYMGADLCVGMRYHAIVLQTMLNGMNYILDYTNSKTGKTVSMLRQLGLVEKYKERYVSCDNICNIDITDKCEKIIIPDEIVDSYLQIYVQATKKMLS